ncbi:cold-shock protein [Halorutilales archaeon Cl-col2-1]|nr:cold shock domain-containing protein [Halobacteria archaeon]
MTTGTVKFYHNEKGYGFIETEAEDDDVFFHITDVDDSVTPEEDMELEFELEEGDEGPRAVNVRMA